MEEKISKFRGCLIGLALGDALGAPFEGLKAGHIKQICGEVEGFVEPEIIYKENPFKWRCSGLYTDDTQQALAVAEALILEDDFLKETLAEIYVQLLDEGPEDLPFGLFRGAGQNFKKAVLKMKDNPEDLFFCGEPSAGNGAAMRIAPIGLFFSGDESKLRKAVIEASLMTHNDPCGISAASAIAKAISLLANSPIKCPIEIDNFCSDLIRFTRRTEECLQDNYWRYLDKEKRITSVHTFSEALSILAGILREGNDEIARSTIIKEANRHSPEFPISSANQSYAPASVIASLYYGLKYKNFTRGVITAIQDGKDTDTVGAMTGALLGTHLGFDSIPEEWVKKLLGSEQILLRADALATKETDYLKWVDFIENEKELTLYEKKLRQKYIDTHSEEIERIKEKKEKKALKEAEKKEQKMQVENLPFAPPPEVWLKKDKPTSKFEKLARSKKRINWKETRRAKKKEKW